MSDDAVVFLDEESMDEEGFSAKASDSWRVLIVDDDPEVHSSTRFSLDGVTILGKPLQLESVYSAEEAYQFLSCHEEPAVILLDVVMEAHDSGLNLVQCIRQDLGLKNSRIILRTGQAGYAPELRVISDFDINDYRLKNELTHVRLITSLTSALRSYQQIKRLETSHRGLQQIINATKDLLSSEGFRQFAHGILIQLGSFLNLNSSEGLVVVSVANTQLGDGRLELDDQSVIAATGRFEGLVARSFGDMSSSIQRGLIADVLRSGEHCFSDQGTVLVCHGQQFSLVVYVDTQRPVGEDEQELLKVFCQNIGLMADNLILIERLNQQAFFDATTLLPNRLSLLEWLDSELPRRSGEDKLLFINIDYYDNFLESLGRDKCVKLLRRFAHGLQTELAGISDFLAHVGEDTFAAVIHGGVDASAISRVLGMDVQLTGFNLHVMSTAVTANLDSPGLGGAELLSAMNLFMKKAKQTHRRQLSHHTPHELESSRRNVQMLRDLMVAIRENQLSMHYQPKWDVNAGDYSGLEALVRWEHPTGKWISPAEFVPLAETAGLADDLFEWVLNAVLAEYATLLKQVPDAGPVAINISGQQMQDLTIADRFMQQARLHGVPYDSVVFEITETAAVIGGIDRAIELLLRLKASGARVSLDDFGTGHSSLHYLSRLPVDQLKLDRSFIQKLHEPAGVAIVRSIINLSKSLGLEVVAEGVEEQREADLLAQLQTDFIQGYFYARPMPMEDVINRLAHVAQA